MININEKVKKCLIWASSYIHFIAFILVGGYFFRFDKNEETRRTIKEVTYITLIFVAFDVAHELFNSFNLLRSHPNPDFASYLTIFSILKILIYLIFFILDLFGINVIKTKISKRSKPENIEIPLITEEDKDSEENL